MDSYSIVNQSTDNFWILTIESLFNALKIYFEGISLSGRLWDSLKRGLIGPWGGFRDEVDEMNSCIRVCLELKSLFFCPSLSLLLFLVLQRLKWERKELMICLKFGMVSGKVATISWNYITANKIM